jgi:hypothetical protein
VVEFVGGSVGFAELTKLTIDSGALEAVEVSMAVEI